MTRSHQIIQKSLSITLLFSLIGVLFFNMEGSVLLKQRTEVHPAKTSSFELLSPVLEENDEDNQTHLDLLFNEFIFNSHFTFLMNIQELFQNNKKIIQTPFPLLKRYILLRTIRI